jgi:outer membrane protein assembly factor BamB
VLVGAAGAARHAAPVTGWTTYGNDVSRIGYTPVPATADPTQLHLLWTTQLDGDITSQALVLRDFPTPGETRIFVGTSKGKLYVINQNGFVVGLKQLGTTTFSSCFYIPGKNMGITGTPVIDPATATIYVPDGSGYVHALDANTLAERPGWPIRLYKNVHQQMQWGALTLVKGKLYTSTGILCQAAASRAYAIDTTTRKVQSWTSVPLSLGGGGGMWGWGGLSYDAPSDSLFTATGDAFPVGRNRLPHFTESAAYGEHVVQFDTNLDVEGSHTPIKYHTPHDSDFTGTPIPVRVAGCPPLLVNENKNGNLYVYRIDAVSKGVYQRVHVADNLNGQPAWSPATGSIYVVGHIAYARYQLTSGCTFKLVWSFPLPTKSVNGPPLVAGNVVWFGASEDQTQWAVDATTGAVLTKLSTAEATFAPITPVDGRVYIPGFLGLVSAYG